MLDAEISMLDLEPIMVKIMDKDEGYGWGLEFTTQVAEEYRKFLALCKQNPEQPIVPSSAVDKFWHMHILDTRKYTEDCKVIFGFFLHHFPYFGMRGEDDAANLRSAWQSSLVLYEKAFGSVPGELWQGSSRCPNCGVRCRDAINTPYREERPRLPVAA